MIDIFVSYAHADDEVPRGSKLGWVTTLADELKKILRRKLGGSGAEIWMDHQLAAHQNVTEELLSKLRASRTLVLVMSPGYQKSHWCQRELANFLLAAEAKRLRKNVFVVEIEPIERAAWPKGLQDLELTPVRFWQREFDDAAPFLLGYPVPPLDGASPYWKNLNELAHWIAQRLMKAPETPANGKRIVLLAETTDDLDEQRESVAALLRQNGLTAVPVRAYPRDTEVSYLKELRSNLHEANLFVQLLGPYAGKRLPDGRLPMVALQADEAFAAHCDRGLMVLQWRTPSLDLGLIRSESHRALLSGRFVRACGFEEFRQEILKAGHALAAPDQASVRIPVGEPSKTFSIFVDADRIDSELAKAACDSLRAYNVEPVASEADVSFFARGIEQQRETMRRCNGVLFIYGRATLSWLSAQFGYAAQAMGLRRGDVWGGVLDGPPAGESKVPFRNKNVMNLDCRDGFDPTKLGFFVDSIRGQSGGSIV